MSRQKALNTSLTDIKHGDKKMANPKPQDFKSCLKFFNVPDLRYEMLSDSEKAIISICHEIFDLGNLEIPNELVDVLDNENKEKLNKILSSFYG